MPRHRSHSVDFKRQVVAEYHAGETVHALGRRHDLSRNLIRIWIEKAEAGALNRELASAELLGAYLTVHGQFFVVVGKGNVSQLGIEPREDRFQGLRFE